MADLASPSLPSVLLGVILAASGCAISAGSSTQAPQADSAAGAKTAKHANLDQFSAEEQARILAVQAIVTAAADEHSLDPELLNAIIWVESRFNPRAKSSAGARGLMQLMPATAAYLAKRMGEHSARAYDPEFNVRAGALYLSEMLDRFEDEHHAVAAYHAGPGNVKRWVEAGEDFPDYSQAYVAKVMDARARFDGVSGSAAVIHGKSSKATGLEADEPLEVPDVDSLPDAAEIHGVARELDYDPYASPDEPEPAPKPVPAPKPEPEITTEPVFVPHPELDKGERRAPAGWQHDEPKAKPAPRPKPKAAPRPKAKPAPQPKPAPKPKSEETGLGVLPDL